MDMADWIEHRRRDGERLGWIRPEGDLFVPVTLLGHDLAGPMDWLAAEEALEDLGLRWLAEPWVLRREDGVVRRVRLTEVTPTRVVVKEDDFGAIDGQPVTYTLPFPAPAALQPLGR